MKLKFSQLSRQHADLRPDDMQLRKLMFEGRVNDRPELFLTKHKDESDWRYDDRCKVAYRNYLGSIVNSFAASLFSRPLRMVPEGSVDPEFWETFSSDADAAGSSLSHTVRLAFTMALLHGRGYVGLDFPGAKEDPSTLLEERLLGLDRCTAFHIPTECVTNWIRDSRGELTEIMLVREDASPPSLLEDDGSRVVEFKRWFMQDGKASFQLFRSDRRFKPDSEPNGNDTFSLVDTGDTAFDRLPVQELRLPDALAPGIQIARAQAEHFRRTSALVTAMNMNMFPIPVYRQGADVPGRGAPFNSLNSDLERGARAGDRVDQIQREGGFLVASADDLIEFAEPSGNTYKFAADQLSELKDEMYRVAHLMAQSSAITNMGNYRSALSKKEDSNPTVACLQEYDRIVKTYAERLCGVVSRARGESSTWEAHGLSTDTGAVDRDRVIGELQSLGSLRFLPETFLRKHASEAAVALLGVGSMTESEEMVAEAMATPASEPEDEESNSNEES